MFATILLSIGVFALAMGALALGYMLSGRCITGSCGGPEVTRGDGEVVCGTCGRAAEGAGAPREERPPVPPESSPQRTPRP